jgi:hypothetical protein
VSGKLAGALLLLVSLALPMSTCSHYEDTEGSRVEIAPGDAILRRRKRGAVALGVRVLEPALIAGSIYMVHFLSTFLADRRAVGAYLAFLALSIYAIATVWTDVAVYREWKERRT